MLRTSSAARRSSAASHTRQFSALMHRVSWTLEPHSRSSRQIGRAGVFVTGWFASTTGSGTTAALMALAVLGLAVTAGALPAAWPATLGLLEHPATTNAVRTTQALIRHMAVSCSGNLQLTPGR